MKQRFSGWRRFLVPALCCALLATLGCSGRPKNVAKSVTGTVTLGGQPLPNALVTFTPKGGGSPSYGVTDSSGAYRLVWGRTVNKEIEGAQIGEHVVGISTMVEADETADPPIAGSPEKVPHKYRTDAGVLTATVTSGSNTIDFTLEPGPVEPPQSKTKAKGPQRGPKLAPGC